MICVIRNGIVFATHGENQLTEIKDAYPEMEIIQVSNDIQFQYENYSEEGIPLGEPLDPREYTNWKLPIFLPEERLSHLEQETKTSLLTLSAVGQEVTQEKIKSIQKDSIIQTLGQELALVKLELIQIKGGSK